MRTRGIRSFEYLSTLDINSLNYPISVLKADPPLAYILALTGYRRDSRQAASLPSSYIYT